MPSARGERRQPAQVAPVAAEVIRVLGRLTTRLSREGTIGAAWLQVGPELAAAVGADLLILGVPGPDGRLLLHPAGPDHRRIPRSAARLIAGAARTGVPRVAASGIAFPLRGEGRPEGALFASLADRGAGDSGPERLIRECAAFLGVALETTRLALLDGATGVYNHRHFQVLLGLEVERSMRFGRPFTLLMSDLDGFKTINDRHGHLAGDRLLRSVAETLRATVRRVDVVARYGGEEFAVILPGTSPARGRMVAEKLRRAIGTLRLRLPSGARLRVTLSLGLAGFPRHARERAGLIAAADAALYEAKSQGRDRVVAAGLTRGASAGAGRGRRAPLRSGAARRSRRA